ncbi:lantibiotic dehydratase [Actinomadura sediminis]|uniref:Lantibiotic dehydratase n=1 Tax=Actinomadura sediminis TaxID=1038904 RepID=A0ABW3EIK3_9ACTN
MPPSARSQKFESVGAALFRAAAHSSMTLPPCPELTGNATPEHAATWADWLGQVWSDETVAEALEHASPSLARQVQSIRSGQTTTPRETRRAVLSVVRYLQRMTGRATPFGLFAGVAPVSFGTEPRFRWGSRHQAVARASAGWLAGVIDQLEGCPELLARLPVMANNTLTVRGNRLVVPYRPWKRARGAGAVEITVRHTDVVRAAVEAARAPIRMEGLADKIQADFPTAAPSQITTLLTELVNRGVLISSLHAPSSEPDALGHLVKELRAADASAVVPVARLVGELEKIHELIGRQELAPPSSAGAIRVDVSELMRMVSPSGHQPLAIDLRLDAEVDLPHEVVREVERAALVLTRTSAFPVGSPTWRAYHQRFYERYGIGSLVPLLDVVSDSGVGWPDGYPGTTTPERRSPMSSRDRTLLAIAQRAALDRRDEVVLDDEFIESLSLTAEPLRSPSHLELGVRVHAADRRALERGRFTIEVVSVSRGAGVSCGRFLNVLAAQDQAVLAEGLAHLPGTDSGTLAAQLSFPPLDPATTHVTRTPRLLPTAISLAEYSPADRTTLAPDDLAVGCDGRRLYLADPVRGRRLEAFGMHALNLVTHTPPLARFLTELGRAQCAQVTTFDWGAASHLPYLPRLRYGRTILSPARWRLQARGLPARTQPWTAWDTAFGEWRARRRLPRSVYLAEGDRLLPLDLEQTVHRVLLRSHLDGASEAVLSEGSTLGDAGWCDDRPHEVIVPLVATEPPAWPPLPAPTPARVITRDRSETPGTSQVLLASLYGDVQRQDVVLTEHLPALLRQFDEPVWWFVRYRDPAHHLRLRIVLPEPEAFGDAARAVSAWADDLRRGGLLREVTYPTSWPETGRWGSGPAWTAARSVFAADSQASLVQLGSALRLHPHALVAAQAVSIAVGFTSDVAEGMRWLIEHIPAKAPERVPRPIFTEATRIADPSDSWATLRQAPEGAALAQAWSARDQALSEYRTYFPSPHTEGISPNDVLASLMHVNFVRSRGIDFDEEAAGLYLARAAALAWTVRADRDRR